MTEFTKAFSTWPCNSSACDHKNAMCSFSPPMISLAEKEKKIKLTVRSCHTLWEIFLT